MTTGQLTIPMGDFTAHQVVSVPANSYVYLAFMQGGPIFVGGSGVTQDTGLALFNEPGSPIQTLFFHTQDTLYAIVPTDLFGTPTKISFMVLS